MSRHAVRLLDHEGKRHGVIRFNDATWLEMAKQAAEDNITITHLVERVLWETALREVAKGGKQRKGKSAKTGKHQSH